MKRDIDLIRRILLVLEEESSYVNWMDIDIEEYSPEQMDYHLELLVEAGLISVKSSERGHSRWLPVRLTWDGHEFLDVARSEARWQKLKTSIEQGGAIPFEMAQVALWEMARLDASEFLPLAD